jgi:hypothetical protein
MGFILKDNDIFIHTKLTDIGRKKIAEGKFNPTKFKIGDSEIDYKYFKDNEYEIEDSFILKPIDRNQHIKHIIPNVSGDIINNYNIDEIISTPNEITKSLPNLGFFNGELYTSILKINPEFIKQPHLEINNSQLNINNNRTLIINDTDEYGPIINQIEISDYILVGWSNQINDNDEFKAGTINSDKPLPYLWYKIMNLSGDVELSNIILTVDRDLPYYNDNPTGISYCYIFPKFNSINSFYNSFDINQYWQEGFFDFTDTSNTSPRQPSVWNMNILFTDRITGVNTYNIQNNKYPSSVYNGLIRYINYEGYVYKNIGIIHFTNIFPENIMGDELLGNTFELTLPTIIWSYNTDNKIGLKLFGGLIEKQIVNETLSYYDLIDNNNIVVGKIFNKLKLIIIEDQELLFAMSYKSNRNWTLPKQINNFNIGIC